MSLKKPPDPNVYKIQLGKADKRLVSRSQAKSLLTEAHQFRKVIVIDEGVKVIRPSFSDEMFRVWPLRHPEIEMELLGAVVTKL